MPVKRDQLFGGGGLTIFGPTPRNYSFKMNKKARKRQPLRSALTGCVSKKPHRCELIRLFLKNQKQKKRLQVIKTLGFARKDVLFINCGEE